jgi:16S rRNA (guanine527-N7)-methyltransferase
MELSSAADQVIARLAASVGARERANLVVWLELLAQWNARMDLSAAKNEEELAELMLADALVLAPHLREGARVIDVGSGAGAPGMALALARPDLAVTLVEPLAKRVSFLRTVIGTTGRTDIELARARGEDVAARFEVAVARATLPPPEWLALGARLVHDGGSVWVLLAKEAPPALEGATLADDIAYAWPLRGAARRAVRYVIKAT